MKSKAKNFPANSPPHQASDQDQKGHSNTEGK